MYLQFCQSGVQLRSKGTIFPQTQGTDNAYLTKSRRNHLWPQAPELPAGSKLSEHPPREEIKALPGCESGLQITSTQATCPAASIWLICEAQGPAGVTQIYTPQ